MIFIYKFWGPFLLTKFLLAAEQTSTLVKLQQINQPRGTGWQWRASAHRL